MITLRKPVVVGVDGKQPAVLRFALSEAQRLGTGLRVVHSAGIPAQVPGFYIGDELYEGLREEGQAVLDDAEHFIKQEELPVTATYALTAVAPIMALETEAEQASMLVIGADDISWPERLLGGAIATHVARHAACPVVVVPESSDVAPPSGRVVLALEGDSAADGSLRFAFDEASIRGNTLNVLHAMPPATLAGDAEAARANIAEVLAGWSTDYPDVQVLTNFVTGDPQDTCIQATEGAELLIVGRSHSHSLPFGLARPLATQILKHAQCPVAVVPIDYQGA